MKKLLVAGLVLAAAVAGVAIYLRGRPGEGPRYRFVTVERGDIESTVSATGSLGAVSTVQVGTQVSGQIAELFADFNDQVKAGQLIARLDPTLLQQAVRQAQADRERIVADLEQKRLAFERATALHAKDLLSATEFDVARANLSVAQASLKSAVASLERAQQNLSYAAIHAPIDGIVIERNVDVGQTVAASLSAPQLFLIAEDLSKMQILAAVDESDIGSIHEGRPVRFTVQAFPSRTFAGKVRQVRLQSKTSENVVHYTVVVDVENPDRALLPGMTATVVFEVARAEDVLLVANAALRFQATEEMRASAGLSDEGRRGRGGAGDGREATSGSSPGASPGASPKEGGPSSATGTTGERAGRGGGFERAEGRGGFARGEAPGAFGPGAGGASGGGGAGQGRAGFGFGQGGPGGGFGGAGRGPGGFGRAGRPGFGRLWYVDAAGKPAVVRVKVGLSDGQQTEVSGPELKAGMQVIAGTVSAAAPASGPSSPFQPSPQQPGRGFQRGFF